MQLHQLYQLTRQQLTSCQLRWIGAGRGNVLFGAYVGADGFFFSFLGGEGGCESVCIQPAI